MLRLDGYVRVSRVGGREGEGYISPALQEADDPPAAMQAIATSDDPFNQWFRERVKAVHGIDIASDPPPQSEQIHDVSF